MLGPIKIARESQDSPQLEQQILLEYMLICAQEEVGLGTEMGTSRGKGEMSKIDRRYEAQSGKN
jgi:hypothetical protein